MDSNFGFSFRVQVRVLGFGVSRLRCGVDLCEQQRPHARRELGRYILLRVSNLLVRFSDQLGRDVLVRVSDLAVMYCLGF